MREVVVTSVEGASTPCGVRLRLADLEDDLALLTVFMRQLREDDPEEGAFDEARCVPAMRRLIADPKLGYSIEFGGVAAFVDELFVARTFRGRGVGTKALGRVIEEARALDVAILLLEVTASNERAKRLYRNVGFADRGHQLMTLRPI
jgi:ribosomal protein S18 acetylase RimI-like enzyme